MPKKTRLVQIKPAFVPYRYEPLEEHIGYIDFRSMSNASRFAAFLEETFTRIQQEAPRGLIVDLRWNGGGNSYLGELLLAYLTDKPYVMSGGKAWKMSRQYKQASARRVPPWIRWVSAPPALWLATLFEPQARPFAAPDGEIVFLSSEATKPGPNPLRYQGNVCFLISGSTFSSATMLANAVEDNDLAFLIGEETGDIPNHFGELHFFSLPHSQLRLGVSSAQFIRANGDAENTRGVMPDLAVTQTPADTRNGVDTVLEAAKAWVLRP